MRQILRNKNGLSMLFVLGIMLVLLALGVSALVAASLSQGVAAAGHERNQLSLYVGSIERALLSSLQFSEGDNLANPQSLGGAIISMAVDFTSTDSNSPHTIFELPETLLELTTSDNIVADYEAVVFGHIEIWRQSSAIMLLSGELRIIISTQTEDASIASFIEVEFLDVLVQGNIVNEAGRWTVIRRETIN